MATRRWQYPLHRNGGESRPLAVALLLSLLIHALLLSLTFGGEEFGLPGLAFPWRERRIEVPDLRIVLTPAHAVPAEPTVMSAAAPSQEVPIDPSRADAPALAPTVLTALGRQRPAAANASTSDPPVQADSTRSAAATAASTETPIRAQAPDRLLPEQIPEPAAIDVKPSDGLWSVARADRTSSVPVISAAPSASSAESVLLGGSESRLRGAGTRAGRGGSSGSGSRRGRAAGG